MLYNIYCVYILYTLFQSGKSLVKVFCFIAAYLQECVMTSHWLWQLFLILWNIAQTFAFGPGYFNAALGRPTSQSSDYGPYTSGRAVDGCLDADVNNNCCTHTNKGRYTWWAVDLGREYKVKDVLITNRDGRFAYRLQNITISGSSQSFVSGSPHHGRPCSSYRHIVPAVVRLPCSIQARYISIEKRNDVELPLTLCEVQVVAECPVGRYGDDCVHQCSGHCRGGSVCDRVTGHCVDGCDAGYSGHLCDQGCIDGYFGEDCIYRCSKHCQGTCHSVTGSCMAKCQAGYTGDRCTQECTEGYYGPGCLSDCHCTTDTCHHVTGCTGGCLDGWEGVECLKQVSGLGVGVYAAVAGVLLVLTLLILTAIIVMYRRKRRSQRGRPEVKVRDTEVREYLAGTVLATQDHNHNGLETIPLHDMSTRNALTQDPEEGYESQISLEVEDCAPRSATPVYMNVEEVPHSKTHLHTSELTPYIQRHKQEQQPFHDEFESIPKQTALWNYAVVPQLRAKNRYKNILPYDYNRVVLSKVKGDKYSDYINASYIKDQHGNTSYIAALGVTPKTLVDFWRMIWEKGVTMVVMVTNLREEGKVKCEEYWPSPHSPLTVGTISVTLTEEQVSPSYTLRKMSLNKEGVSRLVTQYHYTDWPDKGAPSNLKSLLSLRQIILQQRSLKQSPVLIHCSAGVGRTGTLIALDLLLEQLERGGGVDVRKCVVSLRKQRTHMVQTLSQYMYLYTALEERVTLGDTSLSCQNLKALVCKEGAVMYEQQYKFLEAHKPSFSDLDLEFAAVDNKDKNRDSSVIPAYYHRAKIPSAPEVYINAVQIKGYLPSHTYCVTQTPLSHTVTDWWRLVTELKCPVIVSLQPQTTQHKVCWLPESDLPLTCGDLTVRCHSHTAHTGQGYTQTEVLVCGGQGGQSEYVNIASSQILHRVVVLEVTGDWLSAQTLAAKTSLFLSLHREVKEIRTASDCKMLAVMCRNGSDLSGVFVAGCYLLEMSEHDKQVDVFHTVKQIRATRPQLINSLEQYRLLHQLVAASLEDSPLEADYYNLQ